MDFDTVKENVSTFDSPDLYTLDYLIGKDDKTINAFFTERNDLLLLIPKLLGIRENKLNNCYLTVQDIECTYTLNFNKIEKEKIGLYLKFVHDSGLGWLLKNGLKKSVHDYSMGVEAGLNSHARKNRSGNMGENYLEVVLQDIAESKNWLFNGQTTSKKVKELYGLDLDDTFGNRQFDGSLYNSERQKLYLFEVNNFNSTGSKSKASATEFKDLHDRFSRTNHEFIYVTDGKGWDSDKSHLLEAMQYIGKVFNYQMIEDGYLTDYL